MKTPLLLAVVAFTFSAFAQTNATDHEAPEGAPPLEVSVVESHEMTIPGIEADVTNVSDKCIRGYVLDVDFLRHDGTVLRTTHKMTLWEKPGTCMRPQTSLRGHEIRTEDASGEVITHGAASIELVLFSDGTEWGTAKSVAAGELRGFFEGVDYATNPQSN